MEKGQKKTIVRFEGLAAGDGRKLIEFEYEAPDDSPEILVRVVHEGDSLLAAMWLMGLIGDDDAVEEGR